MSNQEILDLKAAIMELTVNIKHMDSKQDEMLQDVKSIKEAIIIQKLGFMLVSEPWSNGKQVCQKLFGRWHYLSSALSQRH